MERTGLDYTVAFAGVIGSIFVLGTILLAFFGKHIPTEVSNGDLAVIGFFFSKGILQTVGSILPRKPPKGENP